MNSLVNGIRAVLGIREDAPENAITPSSEGVIIAGSAPGQITDEERAMKLSGVNRCIELISDSIGKLPVYLINKNSKERITDHPLLDLLTVRPNPVQTPFVCKKLMEASRLCTGNGYAYIERDRLTGRPAKIIPVPGVNVTVQQDRQSGTVWYTVRHPFTGKTLANVPQADMIHVMGYSRDGVKGISVLSRAAEVVGSGKAAQEYSLAYYANGGQPAGVLSTDTDLGGDVTVTGSGGATETMSKKDVIRKEWRRLYGGPQNAGNIAVLDNGLKYSPISISNRDAQFVEQADISIQDIARFFGVPLYKLQSGKQSYSSNEQNAVEYVVGTLHPIIEQYEQELTYKLLLPSEIADGLEIRINMLAELKGDSASRGTWYRNMRELGVFSVNDILNLEDLPSVEGGDERYASLNYVPLTDWKKLSQERAAGRGGIDR